MPSSPPGGLGPTWLSGQHKTKAGPLRLLVSCLLLATVLSNVCQTDGQSRPAPEELPQALPHFPQDAGPLLPPTRHLSKGTKEWKQQDGGEREMLQLWLAICQPHCWPSFFFFFASQLLQQVNIFMHCIYQGENSRVHWLKQQSLMFMVREYIQELKWFLNTAALRHLKFIVRSSFVLNRSVTDPKTSSAVR